MALVGNPNSGKTTLFNALTGLWGKTANFPGTTIECRSGTFELDGATVELLDIPGLYSMNAATSEERIARDALLGKVPGFPKPDALVLIVDATSLERNLFLSSEVLELGVPSVVALNMIDLAERDQLQIDAARLSRELGAPVVPLSARNGRGLEELRATLRRSLRPETREAPRLFSPCADCEGCPYQARYDWAEQVGARVTRAPARRRETTEAIDRVLTHPVVGAAAFFAVMFTVFALIFWVARYPMDGIEWLFGWLGARVAQVVPAGALRSLLVDGVIGGVGGMLVFLPQIGILFFFLSLLEDTGYLARAAFVMDRLMRRVGLPGKAFVPLLSAHACAIPAILSTRVIENRRERIVTMLVLPLMSCSARIPVYAMITALLFPRDPWRAGLLFGAAYSLGIVAAVVMALVFKRTLLRGEARPLVIELPGYKLPSLRNALYHTVTRGGVFVRKAGTVILLISIGLWVLATYPTSPPPAAVAGLRAQAGVLQTAGQPREAAELRHQADHLTAQSALANSFAGRVGRAIEPALRPLGFDWQIGVGILSSFAAREVIVSTLAIVYGVGDAAADGHPERLYDALRRARRSDGTLVFTTAACVSLLIFYVLAMQCLPTQVVTRRESGSWKWAALQFGYMSVLAYTAALVAFQLLRALGLA